MEHYSSLNSNDPGNNSRNLDHCNRIRELIDEYFIDRQDSPPCQILDRDFTPLEIAEGLRVMKKGKSGGLDALSNDMLKALGDIITPFLTILFNQLKNMKDVSKKMNR